MKSGPFLIGNRIIGVLARVSDCGYVAMCHVFLSFTPFFSYFHFGALGGEHYAVEDGKGICFSLTTNLFLSFTRFTRR